MHNLKTISLNVDINYLHRVHLCKMANRWFDLGVAGNHKSVIMLIN